jgi:hydrogenase maturation protease
VIDAVSGGPAPPGTLHRIVVAAEPVSSGPVLADLGVSSHNLGLGSAVALARALDRMPSRLIVHGIQGADFGNGVAISPPVAARLDDLTAAVLADVQGAVAARPL